MKILIVDDSKAIRLKLRHYLEELGHSIAGEAASGHEGVELFQRVKPDLVTLDIVMPEMDGLEALTEIQKLDPHARVIMVTSAATVANMLQAKENGARCFLVKPFQKDKVAEAIAKATEDKKMAA